MTGEAKPGDLADEDLGGESACWLDRVCPDCGVFLTDRTAPHCPRCGTATAHETPATQDPADVTCISLRACLLGT
nr:hypothetical protein [Rhodococcus sp. FXJ9.536]